MRLGGRRLERSIELGGPGATLAGAATVRRRRPNLAVIRHSGASYASLDYEMRQAAASRTRDIGYTSRDPPAVRTQANAAT
jgi:hypothetical protein